MSRIAIVSLLAAGMCSATAYATEYVPDSSSRSIYFAFDGQNLSNSGISSQFTATGVSLGAYRTGRMILGDYAANMDGDAHIKIGPAALLGGRTYTVSVWFKRASLDGVGTIIERPNVDPGTTREGWTIRMISEDTVVIEFRSSGTLTYKKKLLDDTLWHHAALSCAYSSGSLGTTVNAYVDGQVVSPANVFMPAGSTQANILDSIVVGVSDFFSSEVGITPWTARYWNGLIDNVALYNVALSADKIDTLYKDGWMPDPDPQASGVFIIPAVIHQVLYDPPGDMSYARTISQTEYMSRISSTWSFGSGVSTTAGMEAGFHIATLSFGAKVGFEVNADVSGTVTGENSATISMKRSSVWKTPDTEDPAFNGPVDGDLLVCQQMSFNWRLWRQLKPTATAPIGDDDFIYRVFYSSRGDSVADAVEALTVSQFQQRFGAFGTVATQVLSQLAVDPVTKRVRQNLVTNGDLVNPQTITVSSGAFEESVSGTMSRSFTFSSQVDLSTNARVEAKICNMTGRAEATINFSTGGAIGSTTTFTHTCGYLLSDNDGHDRYRVTRYEDLRTGAFVFDVIKDSSFATFPVDTDHARPGLDWTVAEVNPPASVPAGQVQTHTIRVTNTTPNVSGLGDSILVSVVKLSFPHTAELPTLQRWIRRGQYYDFPIELSAPVAGSFSGQFQFIMLNPATQAVDDFSPRQTVNVTGEFTAPVRGVFIRAPVTTYYVASSTTERVTHSFTATVRNTSGQSENLAVGVSSVSTGTVASPRAFSNPVPAGDSVSVVIDFDCWPLAFPHSAVFWARVDTFSATRQQVTFRIDTAGSVLIAAPQSGALLTPGAQTTLSWRSTGPVMDSVEIHYSTDGTSWTAITAAAANTGSFAWTVPIALGGDTIQIRIRDHGMPTLRTATVTNVQVEPYVAVRMRGGRRLGLNDVVFRAEAGTLHVLFGDPAVAEITLCNPAGRVLDRAAVRYGLASFQGLAANAGQTVLAVWRTGRGARKTRRVAIP